MTSQPSPPPPPTATFIIESTSARQTLDIGTAIGRAARDGDVIALIGELGAGKTQLVRGIAAGMGIDPAVVSSPTFVLMQEYEKSPPTHPVSGRREAAPVGPPPTRDLVLVHIDAYRLSPPPHTAPADLSSIGWDDGGHEIRAGAVVAVEWADLVRPALGHDVLEVTLTHHGAGRRIEIAAPPHWRERLNPG